MDSLEKLAYEAALRSLDRQERTLEELRARTGLLLGVSSLAVSFLGRPALDSGERALLLVALVAFATSVAAAAYVLVPKHELVFALAGGPVLERMYAFRSDLGEVHRRLAYDLDRFWLSNDVRIRSLVRWFRLAAGALVFEVAFLLASLGGNLI